MGKSFIGLSTARLERARFQHPARSGLRWFLSMIAAFTWASLLVMPGCVIKIGPGDGQSDPPPSSETSEVPAAPAEPENPPEGADPQKVAYETLKASATAYLLQGYVQEAAGLQGLDPETIDQATLDQLIDASWPAALADADTWVSSLPPSSLVGQTYAPSPFCYEIGCPSSIKCDSAFYQKPVTCFLQACGDAKCSSCPQWFGWLASIYFKAWCTYLCYKDNQVVGSAALVIPRGWEKYPRYRCILP